MDDEGSQVMVRALIILGHRTGLVKKQEILIFPRTARNTGISREILVFTGKYWEIRLILYLQI
jgi:hypothetical protein